MLIVEDEPGIHESLGEFLRLRGFRTGHATTLAAATTLAELHLVHGVILDVSLGRGESGLDFLEWLRYRERYADTPVLVLTGMHRLSDYHESSLRRHRAYVFYKPQAYQELIDYLGRLIAVPWHVTKPAAAKTANSHVKHAALSTIPAERPS